MEKFALGVVVGGLLGAMLVANNNKMRALVKKAQEESKEKLSSLVDEKIQAMEDSLDKMSEKANELTQPAKKKTKKNA